MKKTPKKPVEKKRVKKGVNRKAVKGHPLSQTTLPASGLAEEILNGTAAEVTGQGSAGRGNEAEFEKLHAEGFDRSYADTDLQAPGVGPQLHLVTFNVDQEEYGVNIDRVHEIIRVGQITPVPNIPEYITGVINLRGRIIPVLDLRKKLNLPEGERTKHSRIMVVEAGVKILGMLVDAVSQVFWLPIASTEEAPWEDERAKGYVKSIGKHDSRLIMLIDLDKVLEKDMQQAAA